MLGTAHRNNGTKDRFQLSASNIASFFPSFFRVWAAKSSAVDEKGDAADGRINAWKWLKGLDDIGSDIANSEVEESWARRKRPLLDNAYMWGSLTSSRCHFIFLLHALHTTRPSSTHFPVTFCSPHLTTAPRSSIKNCLSVSPFVICCCHPEFPPFLRQCR